MGFLNVLIEPFKLELQLVPFHATNKAAGSLVFFNCTLLLSDLRELVDDGACKYLFDHKSAKDEVSKIEYHLDADGVAVRVVFVQIPIYTLPGFEVELVEEDEAVVQILAHRGIGTTISNIGEERVQIVEHEEDTRGS